MVEPPRASPEDDVPPPRSRGVAAPGPRSWRDVLRTRPEAGHGSTNPIPYARSAFAQYGDLYGFGGLGRHRYMVRHPDHINEVLIQRASQFRKWTANLEVFLGEGLLVSEGDHWRRQRRIMQPAFHRERIAQYSQSMCGLIGEMIKTWRPQEVLDIGHEMMCLTLRTACRTLFGYDADEDVEVVGSAMQILQSGVIIQDVLPRWAPTDFVLRHHPALKALDRLVYGLIDREIEIGMPSQAATNATLLSTLRSAFFDAQAMSRKQLRDELVTILLAGHETTALALTWTFFWLAMTPAEEAKLHHEVDTVLGGRSPVFDDLEALPFTRRVIQESMRLCPPLWLLPRVALEDVEIGGFHIEAGADVLLWVYLCHVDPRWYPEPDKFKPDRFLAGSGDIKHPRAYFPFGAGNRTCLGNHFAMVEAQLTLASVAQNFRLALEPDQNVQFKPRVTLMPKNPLRMRAIPRQ
ncbi:MAG: cytochrome P450 [Deltaproteobacteria bacterium]|nr:cytochrome P450 [Deltaproteobacteria bacterium]